MKRHIIILIAAAHQVLCQQRDSSNSNFGNVHSTFNRDNNGYFSQDSHRHDNYQPIMSLPPPPPTSAAKIQQNHDRYQQNDQPSYHKAFLDTGSKKLVSFSLSSNRFVPTRDQARIPLPEPPRTVLPPIQLTKAPRNIPEREKYESFTQPPINRQYLPINNDFRLTTNPPSVEQDQPNFNLKLKRPPPLQFSPRREIIKEEEYEYNRKAHYTTEYTPKYDHRDEIDFVIDKIPNRRRDQYKTTLTRKPPSRFDHMWEGEFEDTLGPIIVEGNNDYDYDRNRQDKYQNKNQYIPTTEHPRFQPVRKTERPRIDYKEDQFDTFTERNIQRQITLDNDNYRKYTESPRQVYNIDERNVQRKPLPKRIPPRREPVKNEDEFKWFTSEPSTTEYTPKYDYIDDFDYQNEPITNNRRVELKPLPTLAPPPRLYQVRKENYDTTLKPITVKEISQYNKKEQNIDRNRYTLDRTTETPESKPVPQRKTNVPSRINDRQEYNGVTQRSVQRKYTPNPFDLFQYPDLTEENNLDNKVLKPLTPLRFPSNNEQLRRSHDDKTLTKPSTTTEYTPKRSNKEKSEYTIERKHNNRREEFKPQVNRKLQTRIEHVKAEEHTTTVRAIIDQQRARNNSDMDSITEIPGIDFRLRIPIRKPGIFSREPDTGAAEANIERPSIQQRQGHRDQSKHVDVSNASSQPEHQFIPVSEVIDQQTQRSRLTNSRRRIPALTEYSGRHKARHESNSEHNSYTTETDDSDNYRRNAVYEPRVTEKPKIDRKSLLITIGLNRPTVVTGAQPTPANSRSTRDTKATDDSDNESYFRRHTDVTMDKRKIRPTAITGAQAISANTRLPRGTKMIDEFDNEGDYMRHTGHEHQNVVTETPKIDRKSLLRTVGPSRSPRITGVYADPTSTRSLRGTKTTKFDELMEELMRKTKLINDSTSEESTSDTTAEKSKVNRKTLLRTIGPIKPSVTDTRPVPVIRPFVRDTTSRPRRMYRNHQRSEADVADHGARITRQLMPVPHESVSERPKIDRKALLRTIGASRQVIADARPLQVTSR